MGLKTASILKSLVYILDNSTLTLISKRHFQVFSSRKNTSNLKYKVGFTIIFAKQELVCKVHCRNIDKGTYQIVFQQS